MAFLLQETGDKLLQETDDKLIVNEEILVLNGPTIETVNLSHSIADQKIPILMVDDHGEEAVGLTSPTIVASKAGAASASLSDGTWTDLGQGLYTITLDATDTDTLGWLFLHIEHPAAVFGHVYAEVGVDPTERRTDYIRTRTLHRRTP